MPESFEDLLNTNAGEVQRPQPVPEGDYLLQIDSWEQRNSPQKGTPGIRVNFLMVRPVKGVDKEELAKVPNWQKKKFREDFWLTENSLFRLTDFIEACGIKKSGRTIKQCLPELKGKAVIASINQTPSQDRKNIYNNIDSFRQAE